MTLSLVVAGGVLIALVHPLASVNSHSNVKGRGMKKMSPAAIWQFFWLKSYHVRKSQMN